MVSKMGISAVVRLKLQYLVNCSLMAYAILTELWGILSKRQLKSTPWKMSNELLQGCGPQAWSCICLHH